MSDEQRPQPEFWSRLRNHPAFQAAVVFAGGSWLVLQGADIFGLATDTVRLLGILLVAILILLVGYALFGVLRRDRGKVVVARVRTRTVALAAAGLLVLGTGAWFARPYIVPPLRTGAEVIAVLPFNATGPGVELLGEGLVDLMSTNLNEVGVLRTINPRTTLHEFEKVSSGGSLDLEGQLRVGRNVGAGAVLVGSVVSTGNEVRITAELFAVETGSSIARAQESGRPDSVLALVDQLSVELMQDIWRSRLPLPALRVAAITSQSIPAIKAYLRGEQFYRRAQWDSAAAAFQEAVSFDSTFALAHFRLGEVYGWSESLGSAQAQEHSDFAAQYSERLPARERALIVAHQLHEQGRVEAIDSLLAYVTRFPDDVAGHFQLADARYHAGALLGLDFATMSESFERVHQMDPTFAPNYAHLLELAIFTDDSAAFRRYIDEYRELAPQESPAYEAAGAARWLERDQAFAEISRLLRGELARPATAANRVMAGALIRAYETADLEFLFAVMDTLAVAGAGPQQAGQNTGMRVTFLGSTGRLREADQLAAELRAVSVSRSMNFTMPFIVSDLAREDVFAAERSTLMNGANRPNAAFWLAQWELVRGNPAAAERHLSLVRNDTSAVRAAKPAMVAATEGWLQVLRGDTVDGMKAMKRALLDLGYSPGDIGQSTFLRLQLAVFQTTRPETRAEGIRRLEVAMRVEPPLMALVAVPLAEAYVAEGRTQDAALTYRRFLDLWADADPEFQPMVQSARNALARLVGENPT